MFSTAYQLLGGQASTMNNPLQSLVVIRNGFPISFFEKGMEHLCISKGDYAYLIGVSLSRIQHMKKTNMRLGSASSERILMLSELVVQCDIYFNNTEKRNYWLSRPNVSLGNVTPISICDTAMGIKLVSETITKLKYGFVA